MDRGAIEARVQAQVANWRALLTESVEDDTNIDPEEADEIRQRWEDLKACVERFVIGCERGHYHIKAK